MSALTVLIIAAVIVVGLVAFSAIRSRHSGAAGVGGHGELGVGQGHEPSTAAPAKTADSQRDQQRRGGCC